MQNQNILLVFSLLFISSCDKEKTQNIPAEFAPFVDSFFEEANNRNLDIALVDFDLSISFTDFEENYAGTCNTRNGDILIDEETWLIIDDERKEYLIFHELGHCILDRSHKNNRTNTETCLSIMHEGLDNFDCYFNLYSTLWRDYYIDELFNESVDLPEWYIENQSYTDDYNRIYQIDTTMVTTFGFGADIEFDLENNFVIEMEFFDWVEKTNQVSLRWDGNFFSFCKACTSRDSQIRSNNKTVFESVSQQEFQGNTKLTIKKIDNQYYFYLDEQFVHTFEFTEWESDSFGSTIFANDFGDEFNIDVKVYILEE